MNRDWIEGNWRQARGKVKERWGKLTNDELDVIEGRRDQLVGRVQELYGTTSDQIEKELDEMFAAQSRATF